jgi:hypothetical protein
MKTRNENLLALAVECSLPVFVNNEILLWKLMYEEQSCEQLVSEVSNVLPYYITKAVVLKGARKQALNITSVSLRSYLYSFACVLLPLMIGR